MKVNDYQEKAMKTCLPESKNPVYMLFGLSEEVGELHGKISKAVRKGNITIDRNGFFWTADFSYEEFSDLVKKELGDVLWMCAGFAHIMGWSLEEVAQLNLDKLASRAERNVIDGNGDNR